MMTEDQKNEIFGNEKTDQITESVDLKMESKVCNKTVEDPSL